MPPCLHRGHRRRMSMTLQPSGRACSAGESPHLTRSVPPPLAEPRIVRAELHGELREDPYAWLRDPDWQAVMRDPARLDPAIRAQLEAENAYVEASLAPSQALRGALLAELQGRLKPGDASVPAPRGAFLYYQRHAPAHRRPASGVDRNAGERYPTHTRDLATGADLPDRLDDAHGDLVWANDGQTLYYTVLDERHRPCRVMRHRLGEPASADRPVYE